MKAIVFMDLSEMDFTLLRQLVHLQASIELSEVCLVHYVELSEYTDDLEGYFPEQDRPVSEIIDEELLEMAEKAGISKNIISSRIFTDGSKEHLVEWVNKSNYSFCLMGKKVIHKGTGVFSARMARLLKKSILLTTETSVLNVSKVLVSIDFSTYSKKAIELVTEFLTKVPARIITFNVFKLPMVYFPYVQHRGDMGIEEHTERSLKRLKKFTKKFDPDDRFEKVVQYGGDESTAKIIYNFAKYEFIDLIVIGYKGNTNDEGVLIGSVAEQLIRSDRDIPVLLVK